MKPTIIIARPIFEETLARLREHFEVTDNQADASWTPDVWAEHLQPFVGALTTGANPVNAQVLARNPQLRIVANMAVGYNNFDVPAMTAQGVQASNTPDVLTETTADFGFALLMATARRMTESEHYLRAGLWKQWRYDMFAGAEVHGSTMGILGMGRIGQAIAKRAAAFDMDISYHTRNPRSDVSYKYVGNLVEMATQVDYLVAITPGGAATKNLINADVLKALGPQGFLVNVARGSVVDQAALIEALQKKTIAGAGLDVYVDEPNVPAELRKLDNVVLTPHIASGTVETRKAMSALALANLAAHFAGGPVKTPVPECRS